MSEYKFELNEDLSLRRGDKIVLDTRRVTITIERVVDIVVVSSGGSKDVEVRRAEADVVKDVRLGEMTREQFQSLSSTASLPALPKPQKSEPIPPTVDEPAPHKETRQRASREAHQNYRISPEELMEFYDQVEPLLRKKSPLQTKDILDALGIQPSPDDHYRARNKAQSMLIALMKRGSLELKRTGTGLFRRNNWWSLPKEAPKAKTGRPKGSSKEKTKGDSVNAAGQTLQ